MFEKFSRTEVEMFRQCLQAIAIDCGCKFEWEQRMDVIHFAITPAYSTHIDLRDCRCSLWDIVAIASREVHHRIAKPVHPSWLCGNKFPDINDVIFNNPATIVKWSDGTKTVVKCQNDEDYDLEKGLAMCIAKKALGNKGSYYNQIKKPIEEYLKEQLNLCETLEDKISFPELNNAIKAIKKLGETIRKHHNVETTLPL